MAGGDTPGGTGEHYFTAQPAAPQDRTTLRVTLAGRAVDVVTAAGVFSRDRIDLGTSVLLKEVPDPPAHGELLDLGCGWGPLALTMGLLAPEATVWAVDVNERALDLVAVNAAALGVDHVRACRPDAVPPQARFDAIWSNPPIRVGKAALHRLLLDWLPRLAPGGEAYLVVQRNLGSDSLQTWLAGTLDPALAVDRYASAKGFRILRIRRDDGTTLPSPA